MSVHKETKVRNLIQQRGIVHVGSSRTASTDIGIVGEYTNSGTKYAGLFRDVDDGVWNLFDGLSASPFPTDAVNKGGAGFSLGTMALGQINANNIGSSITNGNLVIAANGTGKVILTSAQTSTAPTVNEDITNKSYVDAQFAQAQLGIVAKSSADARTTTELVVTASGSGVGKTLTSSANQDIADVSSSFDGVVLALNDRVLVVNQSVLRDNGIYLVASIGSVSTPWVLTRAVDADESPSGELTRGAFIFINGGATYQNSGWVLQGPFDTFAIDTVNGNQVWVQFSKEVMVSYTAVSTGTGAEVFKGTSGTEFQFRDLLATFNAGDANLFTATQGANDITFNFDQGKITGTGALVSGSIGSGFGAIATASNISGNALESASTLSFTGSTSVNGVVIPDNQSEALSIREGSNRYLSFVTTDGSERILADVSLQLGSGASQDADQAVISHATQRKLLAKNSARVRTVADLGATYSGGVLTGPIGLIFLSSALFDNVVPVLGDRILVMSQTNVTENGIYTVQSTGTIEPDTAWSLVRAKDADTSAKLASGSYIPVYEGATYAKTLWIITSTVEALDLSDVVFSEIGGARSTELNFIGANGENRLSIPDNFADALSVQEGSNKYLTFVTTNGAEKVLFGKPTDAPSATVGSFPTTSLGVVNRDYFNTRSVKNAVSCVSSIAVEATTSGLTLISTTNGSINDFPEYWDGIIFGGTPRRVLVWKQVDQKQNGIYDVTDLGSTVTPWVLTRSIDFNTSDHAPRGTTVQALLGDRYAGSVFVLALPVTTFGTDNIQFALHASGTDRLSFAGVNAANKITVESNFADALTVETRDGLSMLTFVTTTLGEKIVAGEAVELAKTLKFTGASGISKVQFGDNLASAIELASTDGLSYLRAVTTNGSERVEFDQDALFNSDVTVGGLAKTTFGEFQFANTNTANNKITVPVSLIDAFSVETSSGKYITINSAFSGNSGRVEVVKSLNAKSDLLVDGNSSVQGLQLGVAAVSANTTLSSTHNVINVTTGASDVTLTLPPVASHVGRVYKIAKADAGVGRVIIAPDTTNLIDGENLSFTLDAQYDYTRLTCHGVLGWFLH